MLAHKLKTVIPTDHRLTVEIPAEVPAGPAEVTLLVTPMVSSQEPESDRDLQSPRARSERVGKATGQELSPDTRPEDVLERLRQLVAEDQLTAVRQLTVEAAHRFPDHEKIQLARRVFSEAEAAPNPFVQPTTTAEIEWLNNPPEETRGKWVALVGSELVGLAETFENLVKHPWCNKLLPDDSIDILPKGRSLYRDSHPTLRESQPRIYVKFRPAGVPIVFWALLDTGAHFCLLNEEVAGLVQ
ncbi:MAG: hypothetical protein GY856_33725, partial [bacterium]|nr:hypothetical protein [bacterium]